MRVLPFLFALSTATLHAQQWNWAVSAGDGSNVDQCWGIATDSQGNAFWAGSVRGTSQFGCGTITTGSNTAGVLAKYDASGNCLWVRSVLVTFDDAFAYDIAIDAEDRIYITGSYNGTADFGNGITLASYVGDDIFVARYDVDGTCLWARRAGSSSNDEARGIAVSGAGDVFITGFVGGFTVRFDPLQIASNNQRQIFVASYDSTGTLNWAKLSTGIGQTKSSRGISVAGDRLFITGQFSFAIGEFDGLPISTTSNSGKAYVLACDLDGQALWANSYPSGDHEGMGISADTLGNVFVAARLWGSLFLPDDTLTSVSSNDDILLMKLDREGDLHWAHSTGSTQRDLTWDVEADGMGNVLVAVQFNQTIDFFGTPVSALGGEDALIAKLDGDGTVVWASRPSGFQRDIPLCIHRQAVAPHALYFGGYYWGVITYGSSTIDDVANGDAMMVGGLDTTFAISSYAAAICPGACDGVAHAFTNGDAPFTFAWSTGASTPSISGLCEGTYVVEVTDANGQLRTDTVVVTERTDPGYTVQMQGDSLWVIGGLVWEWYLDGTLLVSDSASAVAAVNGDYHALVTDALGCVWSTDTVQVLTTTVIDVEREGLRAWPNPMGEVLFVEGLRHGEQMELRDALGREVWRGQTTGRRATIPTNGLASGSYLLRTESGAVVKLVR